MEQNIQQVVANHGRWVVECAYCPSAEAVSIGATTFVCRHELCPHYLEVQLCELPAEAVEIEKILVLRPDVQNRNWIPGETVEDLLVESHEHKLALPDKYKDWKPPVKQPEVVLDEVMAVAEEPVVEIGGE